MDEIRRGRDAYCRIGRDVIHDTRLTLFPPAHNSLDRNRHSSVPKLTIALPLRRTLSIS